VTIDVDGAPRDLGGLVDGEPVLAGQIVRVRTTGGGGWGEPLEREPEWVLRDVIDGMVSAAAVRDDYGVVLSGTGSELAVDEQATQMLRDRLRRKKKTARPVIDRGEGFERMLRGEFKPWIRSA
jgi:N-methylhydantoinase B